MVSLTLVPTRTHNKKRKGYRSSGHGGTHKWIGVDGEGVSGTWGHKYVLLHCGGKWIDNPDGLHWKEIFEFLYSCREDKTAFIGFYLGYDFTQWLKTLPRDRAWKLLHEDGKRSRKSTSPKLKGRYLPVDLDGWQVDILGTKRIQFRPRVCECRTMKCDHDQMPWMYICDAGHFFQCSFLQAINPSQWHDNAPCTDEEFEKIAEGKGRRSIAVLDDEMRSYCELEVLTLAKMMHKLDEGFRKLGITLSPSEWYGPGQAAQKWILSKPNALRTDELTKFIPDWFLDACRQSYFGGWFEIMAHGIIPGCSHEYDINSAYPHQIQTLPCLRHGKYERGEGTPPKRELTYVYAYVSGNSEYIGSMLHRTNASRIMRPKATRGWFDFRELKAARKAGCINYWKIEKWVSYTPCKCPPPFADIAGLYQTRLDLGKNSIMGRACKLVYNSCYGKFAQSVGHPTTSNPVYAAMITAGCRTMILEAIASHPDGHKALLMVATDAVFFTSPNPALVVSNRLGDWDTKARVNLTLFKPGVYWDDEARDAIADGKHPSFKARGINARDFAGQLEKIDAKYRRREWLKFERSRTEETIRYVLGVETWPGIFMATSFSMTSCLQALHTNTWANAGRVESRIVEQTSNPHDKRAAPYWDDEGFYRTHPRELIPDDLDSVPYQKKFGLEDPYSDDYLDSTLGVTPDDSRPFATFFRILREGVDG